MARPPAHVPLRWALLLLAACASFDEASGDGGADDAPRATGTDSATTHPDAGRDATFAPLGGDARSEGSAPEASPRDARESGAPANDGGVDAPFDVIYLGDVETVGPPDVKVMLPDAAPDAPPLDACGICDRDWDCNGFTDPWESTGATSCAEVRNGEAVITLYCENGNTIDAPTAEGSAGIWSATASGLVLDVDGMEFTCTPPM